MGVEKYRTSQGTFWKVDLELTAPDGKLVRFRKRRVPTREMAEALASKIRVDTFEGRFFDRPKTTTITVADVWSTYEPVCRRDNAAWQTEIGRSRHVLRHLGGRKAMSLTVADVDAYRNARLGETTRTGRPPSPATLDREVELLKRALNYAVTCARVPSNPIGRARLLRKPNVRHAVIDEAAFARLLEATAEKFRPVIMFAYDTGMRCGEILDLRWGQVDLRAGVVRLTPQDTKGGESRIVYLTTRVREALKELPRGLHELHVFLNPETGKRWRDVRTLFGRACRLAGIEGLWFHDLRRSFVTNARRRGIPESVVMRMSGHRTRAVFDRYNIISETDLVEALGRLEAGQQAELADIVRQDSVKVARPAPKREKPRRLSTGGASSSS